MSLVSVIIPVYNAEKYIRKCLESVICQSYDSFEIIVVDDGSTDSTNVILKNYVREYSYIKLIEIENHGQGYARNLALQEANGEYVLFLDADDFIERDTLKLCVNKLDVEKSDFVVFDWKFFHNRGGWYSYSHSDNIFYEKILEREDILKLLEVTVYFTVNKIYKKSFLVENKLEYLEGALYEDIPFWVNVVIHAKRVSLINQPLYNVRIGTASSTKTNYHTNVHAAGFIKAVNKSIEYVDNSEHPQTSFYMLYKYFYRKFLQYRKQRVPRQYKKEFTKEFLHALRNIEIELPVPNKVLYYFYLLNGFQKEKMHLFQCLVGCRSIKKYMVEFLHSIKQKYKKYKLSLYQKKVEDLSNERRKANSILFMGFDYRYTGNSRYLFEELLTQNTESVQIYFVTEDEKVDSRYRVVPGSMEFDILFNTADIIIFESWIPISLKKRPNSIWIQLWHGTPIKKLLFDSNEKEIMTVSKRHKINKFNDIKRWDYLLADNPIAIELFKSAFQIPVRKILALGYPRVKYLIDNKGNDSLKYSIKQKYHIDSNKIIVSYLPTWRDYNYGESKDFTYKLNLELLQQKLGDQYLVLEKDHSFLNSDVNINDIETQELLLITDHLITDYSSVLFDAYAIDINVILYCVDFDQYQKSRGVYSDIWRDLQDQVANSVDRIVEKVKCPGDIEWLKQKYSYKNLSPISLAELLINHFNKYVFNSLEKKVLFIVNNNTVMSNINRFVDEYRLSGFKCFLYDLSKSHQWDNYKYIESILILDDGEEFNVLQNEYQFYETIDLSE